MIEGLLEACCHATAFYCAFKCQINSQLLQLSIYGVVFLLLAQLKDKIVTYKNSKLQANDGSTRTTTTIGLSLLCAKIITGKGSWHFLSHLTKILTMSILEEIINKRLMCHKIEKKSPESEIPNTSVATPKKQENKNLKK